MLSLEVLIERVMLEPLLLDLCVGYLGKHPNDSLRQRVAAVRGYLLQSTADIEKAANALAAEVKREEIPKSQSRVSVSAVNDELQFSYATHVTVALQRVRNDLRFKLIVSIQQDDVVSAFMRGTRDLVAKRMLCRLDVYLQGAGDYLLPQFLGLVGPNNLCK